MLQARLQAVLQPDEYQTSEKYRIRIYNGSFDVIKLEIKYKWDNRVLKRVSSITPEQMCDLMNGYCIQSENESMEDPVTLFNLAIATCGLRPKIIVEYDRSAYIYGPGNVRITLDRNIRVSDQLEAFIKGEKLIYEYDKEMGQVFRQATFL